MSKVVIDITKGADKRFYFIALKSYEVENYESTFRIDFEQIKIELAGAALDKEKKIKPTLE